MQGNTSPKRKRGTRGGYGPLACASALVRWTLAELIHENAQFE